MKDVPPNERVLTAYDRAHAATYLRLLDAHQAGASWRDAVRQIFKLDPDSDPVRLERMHRTHLERAQWMRDHGYRELSENRAPPWKATTPASASTSTPTDLTEVGDSSWMAVSSTGAHASPATPRNGPSSLVPA